MGRFRDRAIQREMALQDTRRRLEADEREDPGGHPARQERIAQVREKIAGIQGRHGGAGGSRSFSNGGGAGNTYGPTSMYQDNPDLRPFGIWDHLANLPYTGLPR